MAAPCRCLKFVNKLQCTRFISYQRHLNATVLSVSNGNNIRSRGFSQNVALFAKQTVPATEVKKMMESLTDKFAEAREMLEDARESKGTIYFSEDMEEAQEAVNETLKEYKNLLDSLSSEQRKEVILTLGLRMEELKAQQAAMEDSHDH